MTVTRKHLKTCHPHLYRHFVITNKLKGWETIDDGHDWNGSYERAEFTLDGFYQRLIRWIAVDDQVCLSLSNMFDGCG